MDFDSYIIQIFSVVLNLVLLYGFRSYSERQKHTETKQKAIENGLRALLRDGIVKGCTKHIKQQKVTLEELENITLMFEAYKGLDGNGAVDAIYKRFQNVPIEKDNFLD